MAAPRSHDVAAVRARNLADGAALGVSNEPHAPAAMVEVINLDSDTDDDGHVAAAPPQAMAVLDGRLRCRHGCGKTFAAAEAFALATHEIDADRHRAHIDGLSAEFAIAFLCRPS